MSEETNVSSSLINTSVDFLEINLDGVCVDAVKFSVAFLTRKLELYPNFDLFPGNHYIELRLLNPIIILSCSMVLFSML